MAFSIILGVGGVGVLVGLGCWWGWGAGGVGESQTVVYVNSSCGNCLKFNKKSSNHTHENTRSGHNRILLSKSQTK